MLYIDVILLRRVYTRHVCVRYMHFTIAKCYRSTIEMLIYLR